MKDGALPGSVVRPKKFGTPLAPPRVPHFHSCRRCPPAHRRHRWECRNERCGWQLFLDCAAAPKPARDVLR